MGWGALIGGVVAGAGSYLSAQKANSGRVTLGGTGHAGDVNVVNEQTPWGPSTDYRGFMMQHGLDLLKGYGPTDQGNGGPFQYTPPAADAGAGGGGGGGRGGGGGGGRSGAFQPGARFGGDASGNTDFSGVSNMTNRVQGDLSRRAEAGSAYYKPVQDYTTALLNGEDPNAYRSGAYQNLQDFSDPDLRRFEDMLFAGQTPGSPGAGGPATSSLQAGGGFGGGNYQQPAGPVDVAGYANKMLSGSYDPNNPALAGMRDAATRQIKRDFYEKEIPGVTNAAQANGLYGSSTYANALAQTSGRFATSLGDTISQMQYQDYQSYLNQVNQALQAGTSLDVAAGNNAAEVASSANSASASYQSALANNAQRDREARLSALQSAIAQGGSEKQFVAAGLAGIGDSYSRDQQGAMGAVPELSGLDIRDLSAAGAMSQQSDQQRLGARNQDFTRATSERGQDWQRAAEERGQDTQRGIAGMQAGVARSQLQLARDQFNFQQAQYEHQSPWTDLMQFSDVINSASAGYGSTRQYGYDNRSASPTVGQANPWAQAISGGIGGAYVGQNIANAWGGGGGYSPPGGVLAPYDSGGNPLY